MDFSVLPQSVVGWLTTASTFVLGILMWRVQARKGQVDESATVLQAWKQMVEAHQAQISSMRDDFTAYKTSSLEEFAAYKRTSLEEIGLLRERLSDAEKRIRVLEEENAGLRRQIAQNSESSVWTVGRAKLVVDEKMEKLTRRLDEAGYRHEGDEE